MDITQKTFKVKDIIQGFRNGGDYGVIGYNGKLNIRPSFQREFVYDGEQEVAVIDSIMHGFPLNSMYWMDCGDGKYELLDGQQRTMSICRFYSGKFSYGNKFYGNLTKDDGGELNRFLNYELTVYVCKGTEEERIKWFKVINTTGERLTKQELRNAVYTGEWLEAVKRQFSKPGCVAEQIGGHYMTGDPIRQNYLETVLGWISQGKDITIEEYMAIHQNDEIDKMDTDSIELWQYYQAVLCWFDSIFKKVIPSDTQGVPKGKGLPLGLWFNKYKDTKFDADEIKRKYDTLMSDDDVTSKRGIYEYLITGNERALSLRAFDNNQKLQAYNAQNGVCPSCGKTFRYEEMAGDHIIPWSKGGHTTEDNLQMLCRHCNGTKSNH